MTADGGLQSLEVIRQFKSSDKPYCHTLIELLSDNGEQSVLFNNNPDNYYGQLYFYSVGLYMEHPISYYDSIQTMLQTIIEAYKTDACEYNIEKKLLDVNFDSFAFIAEQLNKNSMFWKKHNPLRWEEWYEV